jgi:hypothetical protein
VSDHDAPLLSNHDGEFEGGPAHFRLRSPGIPRVLVARARAGFRSLMTSELKLSNPILEFFPFRFQFCSALYITIFSALFGSAFLSSDSSHLNATARGKATCLAEYFYWSPGPSLVECRLTSEPINIFASAGLVRQILFHLQVRACPLTYSLAKPMRRRR